MENNDYELEKQKFELEKQKLELEKQKLDFEKSKFEHKTSSVPPKNILEQFSRDSPERKTKPSYLLSLIAGVVLAITPFLPWVESHGSALGLSFSNSGNGFECGHGYYILLFAIAALVLAFMKNRLVFIPGLLALIDGITVVSGLGSHSYSIMGVSGGAGFAMGPVIVIISSLVLIASPFIPKLRMSSSRNAKSIDIKSLFTKYKFQLLVSLTALLILKPIFTNDGEYLYHWFWFLLFITVFCIIPILLLKYLKFTKTYKLLFALPLFYLFGFISYSSNILNYGEQRSQFLNNFSDSYSKASPWFSYIFYTLILLIFVVEIIEQKKGLFQTG